MLTGIRISYSDLSASIQFDERMNDRHISVNIQYFYIYFSFRKKSKIFHQIIRFKVILLWITMRAKNLKNGEKNHTLGQGVQRHVFSPLHILSPATIFAGTLRKQCRPRAYIVAGDNICRYRYFFPGDWVDNMYFKL